MQLTKKQVAFLYNLYSVNMFGYNPIALNIPERLNILNEIRKEYIGEKDNTKDLTSDDLNYISYLITNHDPTPCEHSKQLHQKIEKLYKDLEQQQEHTDASF